MQGAEPPTTATTTRPTSPTRDTMPYYWVKRTCEQARGEGPELQLHVPRRPARVRPVPQAPVRPVDPGRLQPVHRVLQRGSASASPPTASSSASEMREGAGHRGEERGPDVQRELRAPRAEGQAGPLAGGLHRPPRTGLPGATATASGTTQAKRRTASLTPKVLGGEEVALDAIDDPRQPLMDWMRSQEQSVLRQGLRQPGLGELFRQGDRQPARRHEPGQPADQRRAARLPGRRVHRPRVRHEVAAPRDRPEPDLPAELADERDQPARRAELQPGGASAGCPPRCCSTRSRMATGGSADLARAATPDRARGPRRSAPRATRGRPAAAGTRLRRPGLRPLAARHQLRLQPRRTSRTCSSRSTSRTTRRCSPRSTAPAAGSTSAPAVGPGECSGPRRGREGRRRAREQDRRPRPPGQSRCRNPTTTGPARRSSDSSRNAATAAARPRRPSSTSCRRPSRRPFVAGGRRSARPTSAPWAADRPTREAGRARALLRRRRRPDQGAPRLALGVAQHQGIRHEPLIRSVDPTRHGESYRGNVHGDESVPATASAGATSCGWACSGGRPEPGRLLPAGRGGRGPSARPAGGRQRRRSSSTSAAARRTWTRSTSSPNAPKEYPRRVQADRHQRAGHRDLRAPAQAGAVRRQVTRSSAA